MKNDVKNNLDNESCYVKTEERNFYVYIDGQQIWVTEEFYHSYTRLINKEDKENYNRGRCLIPAERGELKRCMDNCSECPLKRTGYAYSLDHRQEEFGLEPADDYDLAADIKLQEIKDSLEAAVSLFTELDQRILDLYRQDFSEREIGSKVGLSQKAVNLRIKKCIELLKEKLSGF